MPQLARHRLLIGIVLILLAACRPVTEPDVLPPAAMPVDADPVSSSVAALPDRAELPPEQIVQVYYDWYIANYTARGQNVSDVDPVQEAQGYLSDDLVAWIAQERAAQHLAADPIVCAQDVPRSVRVREVTAQGEAASVLLGTSFEGHQLEVHLILHDGGWQIDQVTCFPPGARSQTPPDVEPAADGWTRYRNGEYGLELTYPSEWQLRELVRDPSQPPIGPENLRLMALFTPRLSDVSNDSDPAPVPFSLELTIGDEQAYREFYGEAETKELLEIAGYPAVRETQVLGDDMVLVRYLIAHPEFPERRVTFIDPVSGFAGRRVEEEALMQFDAMLASFRFVD